ncbi:hypothetical Protein YC6258_01363 [Gynuella sunshinyii YC6258]|uniref:Uncharacterized protein n=1 Tax=Gynuella sunshinyii YC6258 TaxID=1445510 RepID=A0A0C5VGR8_9GAMM|nr:hypothetical Protein YC6258_01363 [Gynuella sunshinyii YC6258]
MQAIALYDTASDALTFKRKRNDHRLLGNGIHLPTPAAFTEAL